MDTLIIVDMQNDFVYGSLKNPAAQSIVEPMVRFVEKFNGDIIATADTHSNDYFNTQEGKLLPIAHCVKYSPGWELVPSLKATLECRDRDCILLPKFTFGTLNWEYVKDLQYSNRIILVGTCTDICVVSNALILKAMFPEVEIIVLEDLCAGLTEAKHQAALEVMKSCQITVMKSMEMLK